MLEHEPDDPHDPLWARAITFTNPISEPDREPLTWLKADSVIVAQLRSWHPASRRPPTYVLERIEWARSSDAVIMRAIADWPRTHDAAVRA